MTFDDVLLLPQKSSVLPAEVNTDSWFARGIFLKLPLVSAAMDTVTESRMAIAMAQSGGIGVVHKNLSVDEQAANVARVKRAESSMIAEPIAITPDKTIGEARDLMTQYGISGLPVVDAKTRLVGILTKRDLLFQDDWKLPVAKVMTAEGLVTAPEGTTLRRAREILRKHRVEKLPIVDRSRRLKGLITTRDILKRVENPNATLDTLRRLKVAAAVGVGRDAFQRAEALVNVEVDAIVIDTAHGHQDKVIETARQLRRKYPKLQLVAGNVGTAEGALALAEAGCDAV